MNGDGKADRREEEGEMRRASRAIFNLGVFLCAISLAPCEFSYAGDRTPAQARVLATRFEKVARVSAIPGPVMTVLAPLLAGKPLAAPVDLDRAPSLWKPSKADRLVFAAKSPTLWMVQYELQAPAPTRHLAIVELKGHDSAVVLEHLLVNEQVLSVPALKNMIEEGRFRVVTDAPSARGGR